MQPQPGAARYLTASEVASFAYCPESWYLERFAVAPDGGAIRRLRDGRLLASGSGDGTVRLWETGTGQPLATLQGHTGAVWGVALSADGQQVASGSFDGTVKLWETQSGTCLRTLRPERRYERMDITGLTGITDAQRPALLALGAVEQPGPAGEPSAATPLTLAR